MAMDRRTVLAGLGAAGGVSGLGATRSGPFKPEWESLAAGYRAPDWFRDAKFGIWAHWSAQCVPEFGDWYARLMYLQGGEAYAHHLKTYGHPSRTGFMEIENLWRAENWRPEALMDLYQKAGAKYFVALACHHDNLDAFASRHHNWNTLRVGPRKDIVGTWAKIARRRGLPFGVSNHSSHAWHWWQPAYGYDAEGPMQGVRYDAYRLKPSDGVGTWWEGLNPQELYTGRHLVIPDGIDSIKAADAWHDAHDRPWWETGPPDDPAYVRKWLARAIDLTDSYDPDFVYYDDTELPFGRAGLQAVAHYYNRALERRGRLDVVVTAKKLQGDHGRAVTEDVERGAAEDIRAQPWQTCTCIGDWHYNRARFENHSYKTAPQVQRMLADIVSKNGNLLLSIPLRGDGTIDADEAAFLDAMAVWMGRNGEAIYGTRPWRRFGEGPTRAKAGMFSEQALDYTAQDVRFTTRSGWLYAIMMAPPRGREAVIASLPAGGPSVERAELLGFDAPLTIAQDATGLRVRLPEQALGEVYVLRLSGSGLTA